MYIDYAYFQENGGTGGVTSAAFARNEFRARKLVDRLTQGRVAKMKTVPEAVQLLMVELILLEETQGAALKDNQPVTSFSNDGYSETYADPLTADRVKELEYELIHQYLSGEVDDNGTPLLYLGVD